MDLTLPGVGGGLPAWSPDGAWIAVTRARPEAGITLTSPDGARQRHLSPGQVFSGLLWSADSRTIYALTSTPNNEPQILAVDGATAAARVVATMGSDIAFAPPNSPGLRLTLGPDGTSFLTTIVRVNTDLWILENFHPPSGLRRWF